MVLTEFFDLQPNMIKYNNVAIIRIDDVAPLSLYYIGNINPVKPFPEWFCRFAYMYVAGYTEYMESETGNMCMNVFVSNNPDYQMNSKDQLKSIDRDQMLKELYNIKSVDSCSLYNKDCGTYIHWNQLIKTSIGMLELYDEFKRMLVYNTVNAHNHDTKATIATLKTVLARMDEVIDKNGVIPEIQNEK